MSQPLLSIIIATKNRSKYCFEAVQSILSVLGANCELAIQDNSDTNDLEQLLNNLDDHRIKYNYNNSALSFVENFNQAMENSTGKFFCILGDDDSITPDILNVVEWMDRNHIESVCSANNVDYIWPNDKIERYKDGEMNIPTYSGTKKRLDLLDSLHKLVVLDGTLNYQSYCLPRTYHGIVKRSVFDLVKDKTGHYFGGLTPDIYSTIALTCVTKVHYVIDYPFTIAGACPASASVANMTGGHSGYLADAPHFRNRGDYVWEAEIPKYYSVETIWAETALKALREMGEDTLASRINLYKFLTYGIYANRKYIFRLTLSETMNLYQVLNMNKVVFYSKLYFNIAYVVGAGLLKKGFKKFTSKKSPIFSKQKINDLNQAISEVNQYLLSNKITFKDE